MTTDFQWSMGELLWHGPTMLFLDRVLSASEDSLTAEVNIKPGRHFFEPDIGVPAWVGLEYMAQAVGALGGYRAKLRERNIPRGMIIGCRNYQSSVPVFAPGRVLAVKVEELVSLDEHLSSFDCEIREKELVASARVTIFGEQR